ncbi:WecB/TagA/CpsF family glycosyltransferase [Bosea beijingensis]
MQSGIIHGKIGDRAAPGRAGEAVGMAGLLRDCAERDCSIFLFGGDSRTVYALRERIASTFPGLRIAGICDADFAGPIDRAVLNHIAAADADAIVSDLPDARFRLFCAQCVVTGIYGRRFNLPGSFADFASGSRRSLRGLFVPARLRGFGAAAKAGLQFARIVLGQSLRRAEPRATRRSRGAAAASADRRP